MRLTLLFVLSVFYVNTSFSASTVHYVISPDNTIITLSWTMLSKHPSQASLSQVSGDLFLEPERKEQDRVEVRIPVSSLEASNLLLTHQLKSSIFFNENNYPWVTFMSQKVTESRNGKLKIFGLLTIKNVQRPVVLDAIMNTSATDILSNKPLILHAHTAISRTDFSMANLLSLVGDTVNIDIDIAARPYSGIIR